MNDVTEEEFTRRFSEVLFNRRFRPRLGSDLGPGDELTEEKVSQWLDTHEDFVTNYFSKKAMKMLHIGARKRRVSLPRIVCPSVADHRAESDLEMIGTQAPWMTRASMTHASTSSNAMSTTPGSSRKTSYQDTVSEGCGTPPPDRMSDFDFERSRHFTHSMSTSSVPTSRKISGLAGSLDNHPKLLHSGWSTSSTPTRRLSIMSTPDFDRDLNPIIQERGGAPSFLRKTSCMPPRTVARQRKSVKELKQLKNLNEEGLLIELVQDIANDLDVFSLSHKILQNVSILTNADRCSLFLVQKYTEGHRMLVSKVYNCNADSTIEEISENEEIVLPWGTGIIGYVAQTGEKVNIPNAYADSRFNRQVDITTGYRTKSLLCVPITSDKVDEHGNVEVVGVAQVLNKNGHMGYEQAEQFTAEDEKIFEKYLIFCGIGISNAQLFESLEMEMKRNEVLLDLARVIFEEQSTLNNIVYKIMQNTQSLIECERLSLLLVDSTSKGSFSQVFDLEARDLLDDDVIHEVCDDASQPSRDPSAVRFPINIGITEHVATTGETLNIPNAYEEPRFDPSVEKDSGFRTRNILCMPVRNSKREIIGVVQLVNKTNGKPFSTNDEHLFEAFAIFCGMAINNTAMYEDCMKAWARQKIALDLLSYHAAASTSDAEKLSIEHIPSTKSFGLQEFSFDDAILSDEETVLATIRMFMDLRLIDRFRIDYRTLCSWVLTVKKNYRQVVYHNWRHAFNVMQNMFLMMTENTEFRGKFTEEEKCALMIACLCHDIDHRGLTNNFQVQTSSPLAQLYGTSVMERHHLDHCIMILNSSGNDVLNSLSPEEYNSIIKVIEHAILATDLALYFKHHKTFFQIVDTKTFDWSDSDHRSLLQSMLMTASDLSAIAKPWHVQERVAFLVAEEFCQEGDLEQKQLHVKPAEMRDRAKLYKFPEMQVGYIDHICMPIYKKLSEQYPVLEKQLDYVIDNRQHWLDKAEAHKRGEWTPPVAPLEAPAENGDDNDSDDDNGDCCNKEKKCVVLSCAIESTSSNNASNNTSNNASNNTSDNTSNNGSNSSNHSSSNGDLINSNCNGETEGRH